MKTDHQLWIEAARKATGAREVVLHKLPRWAFLAIRTASKRRPLTSRAEPIRAYRDAEALLLNHRAPGHEFTRVFDHWGESTIARRLYEGPTLVAEPYAGREHIESALWFADWIGCEVEIGMASWWFPNRTARIEFYPKVSELARTGETNEPGSAVPATD